ncbi:MAG: hypothetical protein GY811_28115 [Myxococcales bacterium]|nr:hypothetical protein [Myxococcales bacterium]
MDAHFDLALFHGFAAIDRENAVVPVAIIWIVVAPHFRHHREHAGVSLPEALLSNEVNGHEAFAHPGASQDKIGLFSRACGGTLLLEEVGQM